MDQESASHKTGQTSQATLAEGYRQMAADIKQEIEAEEWSEAMVGDVLDVDEETVQG